MQERLSKLQKFILTAAYKKTVRRKPLPECAPAFYSRAIRDAATHDIAATNNRYEELKNELYFSALYESDILLNFYGLEFKDPCWSEKYAYEGGSNKEKTALRRSIKRLYESGYINPYWHWIQHAGEETGTYYFAGQAITTYEASYKSRAIITLTEKGREKAGELLKL